MTVIDDLADRTDADLIEATRAGDDQAYAELWTRHQPAALRQARALTRNDPEDLVSEAFSRILVILRDGGGPDTAFRPYLLTAVRRLSIDRAKSAQQREVPTGEESDLDRPTLESLEGQHVEGVDAALAWSAWTSLPEPTRALLWHAVVEEERPAEIARTLGVSANSVASRTKRARERLRQAYLSEHAAATDDEECRRVRARLGSYVRRAVSPRGSRQIRDHLHTCRECRAAYAEIRNIDSMVLGTVAAIITGAGVLYTISRVLAPTTAAAATVTSTSGAGGAGSGTAAGVGSGSSGSGSGAAAGSSGSSAGGSGTTAGGSGTTAGGSGAADKSLPSKVAEVASTPAGRVLIGVTAVATVTVVALTAFARQPPPSPSSTEPVAAAPTTSAPTSSEPSSAAPAPKAKSTPAATAPAQQALDLDAGVTAPTSRSTARQATVRSTTSPTRPTSTPTKSTPTPTPTRTRTTPPSPTTAPPAPTVSPSPTATATPTEEPTTEEPPPTEEPPTEEPTEPTEEPPTEEPPTEEPTDEPTDPEEPSEPVETRCLFIAATLNVYRAQLEVPPAFLLVSVKDLHNGVPYEHLKQPDRTFDQLVQPGLLAVVVQRVREGDGELQAKFSTQTGRPLGTGTCTLK